MTLRNVSAGARPKFVFYTTAARITTEHSVGGEASIQRVDNCALGSSRSILMTSNYGDVRTMCSYKRSHMYVDEFLLTDIYFLQIVKTVNFFL